MRDRLFIVAGILIILAAAGPIESQTPDGTLSGRVTHDGEPMPGVTVNASSQAMQGTKTTVTGSSGDYLLRFLPAGDYTVTFTLDGFKTLESNVKISAAQTRTLDAIMIPEAVTGEIEVTSAFETISSQTEGSVTYELGFLEELPVQRDLEAAVLLAPGTTVSTVTNGLSLSGSAGHESLYLVNGVDMREPISGSNLGLYIEDAIQETTVATSSISAEYGRFSGGVVNLLTKSGGNEFSGSFRVSLTNDSWSEKTPVTVSQEDKINPVYEATLGGRFIRDKLWFFIAARDRELDEAGQSLSPAPIPFTRNDTETRYEAKLTFALNESHRLIGSYLTFEQDMFNPNTGFPVLDVNSLIGDASLTQDLWGLNYTGVITPNFFLEAQYSERNTEQAGYGGKTPQEDVVGGTAVIYFVSAFENGNSPLAGCGSCPPLTIEQQSLLVKGSYFLSTNRAGSHDLVFGVEDVTDGALQHGAQTASGWWIAHLGAPVYDAAGNWTPDFPQFGTVVIFNPRVFAATLSDYNTRSAYVNDTWRLNTKTTLNLGVRYDRTDGTDGLQTVADDQRFSPRLGLTWDLNGDGGWLMHAGLGRYTSYVNQTVGSFSGPGSLWQFAYIYVGPTVAAQQPHAALEELFDNFWNIQGGVQNTALLTGNVLLPGVNTIVQDLKTPYSDEMTIGFTRRLGSKGVVRADYVHREYHDFFAIKRDTTTGSVCTDIEILPGEVINQCFDKGFFVNDDDSLNLQYDGLHTQLQYRFNDRVQIGGTWTWSHSIGNWAAGAAGSASESGNFGAGPHNALEYPEYHREEWNYPEGDLPSDRRHKVRAWFSWDAVSGRRHNLNVSALLNFTTGFPYNAYARVSIPPGAVENPGYYTPPPQIGYYYTSPDAFRTEDISSLDLALNYSFFIPVGANSDLEIFIQPEVLNVFNQDGAVNVSNLAYPTASFDPFTETPVEGVHWAKAPGFGEPQAESDYQQPRTFRVSLGIRF